MGMFGKVRDGIYHLSSLLIHGRFNSLKWDYRYHVVPPLSSSTTFRLSTASRGALGFQQFAVPPQKSAEPGENVEPIYIYERLDEPTRGMLEERLAFAEGGAGAVCFATGMAAVSAALMTRARAGQRVVAHRTLYGCTYSLLTNWLPRFGIEIDFVDLNQEGELERCLDETVAAVYFETPSNPLLELIDIAAVVERVQRSDRRRSDKGRTAVVVDNTFATPFGQRPLGLGADLVVHSLTKNICGFGTAMGGAVIYKDPGAVSDLLMYRKDLGGALSSTAAWPILVYGLPTLPMRLKQQSESAQKVASFLEAHPKVARVRYPGLKSFPQYQLAQDQMRDYENRFAPGSLIYFELAGEGEAARQAGEKLINHVAENAYAMTLAVSLGQIRTLIEHPASMTHAAIPVEAQLKAGIAPAGIRISVGNEAVDDILRDLESALAAVS